MKITTIGIDLAKAVFQVHGVDAQGNVIGEVLGPSGEVAVMWVVPEPSGFLISALVACGVVLRRQQRLASD